MPEQVKHRRLIQEAFTAKPKRPPPSSNTEDIWDTVRALIRRGASDDYDNYRRALTSLCPEHITQDEFLEMCTDYALLRVRP